MIMMFVMRYRVSVAREVLKLVWRTELDMLYMALVLSCVSRQLAMRALARTCPTSLSDNGCSRASRRELRWMAW